MKTLKIIWLHSHLSLPSGGTKFVLEAIRELSKHHEVDLYVQKATPQFEQLFKKAGINIITMSKYSTGDILFWINFSRQIKHEMKFLKNQAKNYDVVISSMFPMNVEANALGLPHLQSCFQPYAFFWDSLMINKLPFFQRLLLKFAKKKFGKLDIEATKKSDKIVTVIAGVQKWISKVYQRDSLVVHPGVDISFFKPTVDLNLQNKYAGKKIILHSTDWTPLKRTNWLIDEFVSINSKINNAVLLIMEVKTVGVEREKAIKKIDDKKIKNIELCGSVPEHLLPAYYSLADVCVYVGIGEGAAAASYIVLESMACETPVIRTNYSLEEVEDGKTGYLFEKDDKESFKKYVIEFLTNPKLKLEFGKAGRNFIQENRSWEKFAKLYEKNLFEIIG